MKPAEHGAFSVFGIEPRPFLDLDEIQKRFLELAARAHPDQGGDSTEFGRVNAANQVLRDTSKRLRLLAELEGWIDPGKAPTELSPAVAELFSPVQQAVSQAEASLRKTAEVTTPLARAVLAREILHVTEAVESAIRQVREALQKLDAELLEVDRAWPERKNREGLVPLIGGYAFLRRWLDQLQEKAFRLSQNL